SALSDPKPGVTLTSLPVDIMKPAPNYRFTSLSFESDELDTLTQQKAGHDMPVADFHCLGCKRISTLGPLHPLVELLPRFHNRRECNCTITNLFRPDRQARRADRHWHIDQNWVGACHAP